MALNYDVAIKCIDENGDNIGAGVKVHAYFYKVDSASSDSTWDGEIRKTAGSSKVSFNLGDNSFLTSEGLIKTGDKILITAWLTDNVDTTIDDKTSKDNNTITRCVNIIHTVDTSSSSWSEDITLMLIDKPICDFSIPDVNKTGHSFTVSNSSTISVGPYSFNGRNDLYQELNHYSQDLFLGREIKETVYDFVENTYTVSGIDDKTYSYIDSNDYNTVHKVYNYLGNYCQVTKDYHILYNKPTIAFDYTFTKLLNSDKHIGVGNDDELKTSQLSYTNYGDSWLQINATFDWYVYDLTQNGSDNSDNYNGKDENFEPTKLYLSSSVDNTKKIRLTINWNDGFDDHSEVLEKIPYLDEYNIKQNFNWITQKGYKVDNIYIPLGDDDKMSVTNINSDDATQDYDSNTQWKTVQWDVTKKKNDGSLDNESLILDKSNSDDYLTIFEFFVKYYHDNTDKAEINQELVYWDGFKDVTKNLNKQFETEKYRITHNFKWSTAVNGDYKVVIHDNDKVTLTNLSIFGPQNNQNLVTEDRYYVTKDKYESYTDETISSDDEEFIYTEDNLTNKPEFYVHKQGNFSIQNIISFYDGYDNVSSEKTKTITAEVLIPNPKFTWSSRYGINKTIVGRDDLVTFTNSSTVSDYYNIEYGIDYLRNLQISWYINNYITATNYSNPNSIGGNTYTDNEDLVEEFLNKELIFKPEINYWTAKDSQDIKMIFFYNDGYFNRNVDLIKTIKTIPYSDLIPGATYTNIIPDRHTDLKFKDNSTNNETRIIDEDWSLIDRFENNSMTIDKQGTDNFQIFLVVGRETETTTTINSNENHTLSQDEIRWDDGFHLKTFSNTYNITTTEYGIIPKFSYSQIYITGPEIEFTDISTKDSGAVFLTYDLEINDKENDGTDAFAAYREINYSDKTQHTYKSVSNSPFESDIANKEVTIFQDYDDGWNRVYDSYTENILVKPNRISQNFDLIPQRHSSDTETADNIITGNNPINFKDSSDTLRIDIYGNKDFTFIKNVNYDIEEIC